MRHALGVLGICAAGVLLLVSAAMNWRFGYQLGTTEFDGVIYGSASAAADCLKALVPFFFFAALKNKMWSQAVASAVVWTVVTAYSLTSALGHAALNRADTSGQRAAQVSTYKDLRADLDRAKSQLGWIPQHRPAATVSAELAGLEKDRAWGWTQGCTKVTGPKGRAFCSGYTSAKAELASAQQAQKLETRIAEIQVRLGSLDGVTHSSADPQAAVLTKLAGVFMPGVKMEDIQTALVIFIALLLEVGSGLGMYIAFSQWRIFETRRPVVEHRLAAETVAAPAAEVIAEQPKLPAIEEVPASIAVESPKEVANDNRSEPEIETREVAETDQQIAPVAEVGENASDIARYRNARTEDQDGSSLTVSALYEDYCEWCEDEGKEPLALPTFGREFGEGGVQKAKIAGRVRYIGIALKARTKSTEDKKPPVEIVKAA
jgi:hypothetical protein